MKLLILGGTLFLGRHLVEAALVRGHAVTIFHRGQTNPALFPQVERVIGDRGDQLDRLAGRQFDAVIDPSGRVPRHVATSTRQFKGQVGHYTFISSISVYERRGVAVQDETAPIAALSDPDIEEMQTAADYAGMKARCEQYVEQAFPHRGLIIRPGLIVGPYDATDRYTYWPVRIARGGEVLLPDIADRPIQYIDGRDLAVWIIRMVEEGRTGIYNATGPEAPQTFGDLVRTCQAVSGREGHLTWVPEDFLLAQQVRPWVELPLWVPAQSGGFLSHSSTKARSAGLCYRTPEVTAADTLAWAQRLPPDRTWAAGLSPEREAEVLGAAHEQRQTRQ